MIFIEQQVYDVSRLFLVKKKTFLSDDNSRGFVVKKYFLSREIKLKLCEFFNDTFYLVSSSKRDAIISYPKLFTHEI